MPIDSESLSNALHSFGINMRYLSHINIMSQMPHVKEICLTEMLARTCKNIMNEKVSELILENKVEHDFWISEKQRLEKMLLTKKELIKHRGRNISYGEDYDELILK
jgi:hypothetical protein